MLGVVVVGVEFAAAGAVTLGVVILGAVAAGLEVSGELRESVL